jgi:PAS domain S-box-containing protein
MYGLDPTEPPPMLNALEFFAPEQRTMLEAALAAAMQRGVPHDLELQLNAADGVTRWVRTICRPIVEDGRVVRVRGSLQDISDRKQVEAALRDSEQRYRRLVDVLPTAVLIHDGERVLYCNPAFVRLVGAASTEDIVSRALFECLHPDDRASARARLAHMNASGEAAPGVEMRLMHVDGRPIPTYSVSTPISGYGPRGFLIAMSDLTDRERATQLLRNVLGSVSDAIITIDTRGVIRSANPAAARQFGHPLEALIGANITAIMPEPYCHEHDGYLAAYLRTGQAHVVGVGREVEGQRSDGTRFPAELSVTDFTLDGERHFTGVLRDISARKRLEEQFRQAQKMEAVGRLAGGVAHDFNNLLTVIGVCCEVLLVEPLADDQRDSVVAIRDASERATRLTQQLLAFGRKAILEPRVIDLNELVSESARLLRRLLGEDIILRVLAAPKPVRVKADPTQLEQVIMNLAVNARDAMPTGGRLTIETRIGTADDGSSTRVARLTIADTGQGMTEEVRRSIFEPFFTTKGVGKGTGLGLAVVDGALAQCGGGISVDSTVGAGTTFHIWLPLVAASDGASDAATMAIASRGAETVLLVEDDDAVRGVVRLALTTQGFTVLEAADGPSAARLADAHDGPIHLLLSDVVMPEMGGRQVLEAVRRRRPEVRALFMSGYTDDDVLRHGVVESADAFIQKPFTPLGLARKVRQVLDAADP